MRGRRAAQSFFGLCAAGLALSAASGQVVADLPMDLVPPGALAAAQEAVPDAAFESASLEVGDEQGRTAIEIAGVDPSGRHVEVDLFEDGSSWMLEEIERLIDWEDAPAVVQDAVRSFYGRTWRPTLVERSENAAGEVVFEIEGVDRYEDAVELIVSDEGALISLSKFNAR